MEHIDVMKTCYDRIAYTKQTVPNLLEMTEYSDCTIWLVNNGLTDGTDEYLKRVKAEVRDRVEVGAFFEVSEENVHRKRVAIACYGSQKFRRCRGETKIWVN